MEDICEPAMHPQPVLARYRYDLGDASEAPRIQSWSNGLKQQPLHFPVNFPITPLHFPVNRIPSLDF